MKLDRMFFARRILILSAAAHLVPSAGRLIFRHKTLTDSTTTTLSINHGVLFWQRRRVILLPWLLVKRRPLSCRNMVFLLSVKRLRGVFSGSTRWKAAAATGRGGKTTAIDDEDTAFSYKSVCTPRTGWFSALPAFAMAEHEAGPEVYE